MLAVIFAGILTGSFGLPMKYTTRWKWEHTWMMWTLWTLLVIPLAAGLATIPNLFTVLSQSGTVAILKVFLFGLVWGISAIAFGFGIHYLGLGLGYSLMMGMIIAIGSLFPLLAGGGDAVRPSSLLAMVFAVAVIVMGIALSTWAAVIKTKDQRPKIESPNAEKKSLAKGLVICLVAGATAPFLNFAFVYGDRIRETAVRLGTSRTLAPNAVWVVALFGGFIVNLTYTLVRVHKNKTWNLLRAKGTGIYYFYTFLMGLFWAGSIFIYGMGAANLGPLGASVGWAVFNAIGIFWANLLGILTREWQGVGRKGMLVMAAGLVVLLVGVFLVKLV
jgi:L-rhamnose-H+ transport protein